MFKKSAWLLSALALTACQKEVDFQDGLPTVDTVKLALPASDSQGQGLVSTEGGVRAHKQGEVSGFYLLTLGSVVLVNGTTAFTLAGLAAVASQEPTSVDGDTATFGPHTPAGSSTTWRLTVTRTDADRFTYGLSGKPKDGPDSAYVTLLSGNHTVAVGDDGRARRGYGEGSFLIEWEHVTRLSNQPVKKGSAEFRYTRAAPAETVRVEVDFREFHGDNPVPLTALYRYTQVPGGEGSFAFAKDDNIHWFDLTRLAPERLSIKSRWKSNGEGRSDARVRGGDLTVEGTLGECWDARFRSTVLVRSDAYEAWGSAPTGCAYTAPDYAD
ncbi:hypothetical protein [Pyxidicoccus xibeiensis]|uniref:hypothetical protein n=1 Tax=Pyxidicoccus xibeiensis TaxID=2906759 RepID=UPI0020A73C0C|nr:hypothetical protein [Pyxidicoccus xibeiensis]MCP3140883.1 hypothetical protein [Pyxidicoccus xibeiensis]